MDARVLASIFVGFLLSCSSNKTPESKPTAQPPSSQPSSQAASQPSSQPSEPGEKPADHPNTQEPVALANIFEMPKTKSDVVLQIGEQTVNRKALEAKLRLLQIQLKAAGMPDDLNRKAVLQAAITQLVEPVLMAQVARDLGITLDKKQFQASLTELNARIEKDEHFKAFLAQAGNTTEQREQDVADATLSAQVRSHLTEIVKTETATAVAAYYEKNKRDYIERGGRETWRIFIRAPQGLPDRDREANRLKAESIHKKAVENNKKFENLAKLYSEGGKANSGGYIGWISKGTFAKELDNLIVTAKPNSILPLYDDASGFYIYKIGKQREERVKPLSEVQEAIFKKMFRKVLEQKLRKKLGHLKEQVKVQVHIPELNE